ncbi:22492_t:CDS:2, partial [Gigaspora margarita]
MSKSLGNVVLAKHFYEKYGANVFRYLTLNTRYNQVINLSEELIQEATNYIQKIKNLSKKLNFYLYTEQIKVTEPVTPQREEMQSILREQIITSLLSNLNTVKVLFFLEQTINSLNKSIDKKESDSEKLQKTINDFYFILDILGFRFDLAPYDLTTKSLIRKWQTLRVQGEYDQADQIRKQLQERETMTISKLVKHKNYSRVKKNKQKLETSSTEAGQAATKLINENVELKNQATAQKKEVDELTVELNRLKAENKKLANRRKDS